MELADKTADAYRWVYGEDHPYYYGCLGNLALMRRVTNHPEEARRLDQDALAGLDRTAAAAPRLHPFRGYQPRQ